MAEKISMQGVRERTPSNPAAGTKSCAHCGSTFPRHPKHSDEQWARTIFCSRECAYQFRSASLGRIGERHGSLEIIEDAGIHNRVHRWRVRCDCGHVETMDIPRFRKHTQCSQCRWPKCQVCGARAQGPKSKFCSWSHLRHWRNLIKEEKRALDLEYQEAARAYARTRYAAMTEEERAEELRRKRELYATSEVYRREDNARARRWRERQDPDVLREKDRQKRLKMQHRKMLADVAILTRAQEPK